MKTIPQILLTLALATASLFASSATTDEQPAAPYFQLHGEHRAEDFPLKDSHAEVEIVGTIAQVVLTQTYTNQGTSPIDATCLFPASTQAAVNGMTMTIGDRVLVAKIEKRETARKKFEQAKKENKSASLLSQHRPNLFQMEVARIMPGDELKLTLRYSELLIPAQGIYEFVLPTAIGPRYHRGGDAESFVSNPHLDEGRQTPARFSVDLAISTPLDLQSLTCSTHETKIDFLDQKRATLSLPDSTPDRDFIVRFKLAQEKIASGLLLHDGEDENFFVLQVEPPVEIRSSDIPNRDYVFLIDVSGSMSGFPMNLTKELFRDLIGSLRSTDTFNVVFFASASDVLSPTPLSATPANLERALAMLDQRSGGGGTELLNGLRNALALPGDRDTSRSLILITDGFIDAEAEVFELIREGANGTNIFPLGVGSSVNRHLIEGLAHLAGNDSFVVTHSSETESAVKRFRDAISTPLLTGLSVTADGFNIDSLQPKRLPDLFASRPLTLIGKWNGEPTGTIKVSGVSGEGKRYTQSFSVAEAAAHSDNPALPTLWARERVRSLADYAQLTNKPAIIDEVTQLGLKYELLTPFTSFVAIDDTPREGNKQASIPVTQPQPLPSGVTTTAKGSVPEPSAPLLLAMVVLTATFLRARRTA